MVGIVVDGSFGIGDMLSGGKECLLESAIGSKIQALSFGCLTAVADIQPCVEPALVFLAQGKTVPYLHANHRGMLLLQQGNARGEGNGEKTIGSHRLLYDRDSGRRDGFSGGVERSEITHATTKENTTIQ